MPPDMTTPQMTTLRLLADDLTGALDTAAAFVPLTGPIAGLWQGHFGDTLPANAAMDAATREGDRPTAIARHRQLAPALAQAEISFKKIDSLLRGHTFAEIAACAESGLWDHIVLAPAFPFQGRITEGGWQMRQGDDGGWLKVADIRAAVLAEGLQARVAVFDAASDADLQAIVSAALARGGRILWCGSAGLAQALVAVLSHTASSTPQHLRTPILGLFGSDQDVTARQLLNCGPFTLRLSPGSSPAADGDEAEIAQCLRTMKAAMVGFTLPPNTPRADAARMIGGHIAALLPTLPRPGALIVAGGETLRTVCDVLGATHLEVVGAELPGVPRSILRGGVWDGVDVISKSGAFGAPNLLRDLLASADISFERTGS